MHRADRPRRRPSLPRILTIAFVAAIAAFCSSPGDPAIATSAMSPTVRPAAPTAGPVGPAPSPTQAATRATDPTAAPATASVPLVVVADFRSTVTAVDRDDLRAALAGSGRYGALELVKADADAVLRALSLAATDGRHLVLAASPDTLSQDLAAHRDRLGILRASQVRPSVRALAWGKRSLFGVDRVRDLAGWPLMAELPADEGVAAFHPADLWTFVAAGDVMLDRGVRRAIVQPGHGVDFPFDGGTARIVGRRCCSPLGLVLPVAVRTAAGGSVRALLAGADRSMVNLEGPAPVHATYHADGLVFNFSQASLGGLANAGIDIVSLANNHIGNAARRGIVETVAALDRLGIDHAGAGATSKAARAPATFTVGDVRVAVLAYDAIAPRYAAGATTPGSAGLSGAGPAADIRAARRAGADVVIVYPHWGVEYRATPTSGQQSWAHRMIDAGADLVIGNHAHWAAAMEVYRGRPIWYALGDFVFDIVRSEETEEGLILELTFRGPTLVQARMRPTVILDASQPNLLDAASGRVVLDRVYKGSRHLLPW